MENVLTLICILLVVFLLLSILALGAWDVLAHGRRSREEFEIMRRRLDAHRHYLKTLEEQGLRNWRRPND